MPLAILVRPNMHSSGQHWLTAYCRLCALDQNDPNMQKPPPQFPSNRTKRKTTAPHASSYSVAPIVSCSEMGLSTKIEWFSFNENLSHTRFKCYRVVRAERRGRQGNWTKKLSFLRHSHQISHPHLSLMTIMTPANHPTVGASHFFWFPLQPLLFG